MTNVTVLGAGAWGTAFGQVLADAGNNVTMWAIEPEIVEGIRDHHHNGVRLPSVKVLPSNMTATGDRAEAVANADIVIVAIAAQFARVALVEFKDLIPETALVASLMKGIERTTGKRMDEVVMETLDLPADRFAAISGPNLSKQIADREPAATVVACENLDNARKIAAACTTDYFRAFVTRDVIGLEMCGSLKNVVALAVGMARGAGYRRHDRNPWPGRTDRPGRGGRRRSEDVRRFGWRGRPDRHLRIPVEPQLHVRIQLGQGIER